MAFTKYFMEIPVALMGTSPHTGLKKGVKKLWRGKNTYLEKYLP